jgi:hypothetical protein
MICRAICTLGLLVAGASAGPSTRVLLLFALLAVAAGWWAGSELPMVAGLAALVLWMVWGPSVMSPWVLLAAGGLVVAHLAAHLTSLGPPDLTPDRASLRRWTKRGALMVAFAALVWAVLGQAAGWQPSWAWLAGLATVATTLALALVLLRTKDAASE